MSILLWMINNFGAIVQLIGMLGGLLLASGYLRQTRLRAVIGEGVAFADQYERQQLALGHDKPAGTVLKAMALSYIQQRMPGVNVGQVVDEIEVAVQGLHLK
jgi:hypothetical protein